MRASRTLAWSLAREIIQVVGFAATAWLALANFLLVAISIQPIRRAQLGGSA